MQEGVNAKYRLKNIYAKIERSGKNSFVCYEDFREWALENGYKPWKVLSLLDEDGEYSNENCIWNYDRRGSAKATSIRNNDTMDNVVKNVKILCCDALDMVTKIQTAEFICRDMRNTQFLDKAALKDIEMNVEKAKMYISNMYNSLESLELNGVDGR